MVIYEILGLVRCFYPFLFSLKKRLPLKRQSPGYLINRGTGWFKIFSLLHKQMRLADQPYTNLRGLALARCSIPNQV